MFLDDGMSFEFQPNNKNRGVLAFITDYRGIIHLGFSPASPTRLCKTGHLFIATTTLLRLRRQMFVIGGQN